MRESKASTVRKTKPVSVGEVITNDYLRPCELTQNDLAKLMGVSRKTVNELCVGKRSITADTAMMLEKVFSTPAQYWMCLQQTFDIWLALNDTDRRKKINGAKKYLKKKSHK